LATKQKNQAELLSSSVKQFFPPGDSKMAKEENTPACHPSVGHSQSKAKGGALIDSS